MPARLPDPFASMRWRERFALHWRLQRSLRVGLAERNETTLAVLRSSALGSAAVGVENRGTITELTFAAGSQVRLLYCHRPTVRRLRNAIAGGVAVLDDAANHGQCWGLYFQTVEGRLPLLARQVRVLPGRGGRGGAAWPAASAPPRGAIPLPV